MKSLTSFCFIFCIAQVALASEFQIQDHQRVACTALRDHSNSPTYAFELVKQDNQTFEARYLHIPGGEGTTPEILGKIDQLKCRFLKQPSYLFQCQKFGASVESIRISEEKLNLVSDKVHKSMFREFRAVGINVPNQYLNFRFGSADICVVQ